MESCSLFLFLFIILLVNISNTQSYHHKMKYFLASQSSRNKFCRTVVCSTIISPPKTDKKKKGVNIEAPKSPDIFKESRDIQKEFESYGDDDKYKVILYNDPFNKRIYVATCLMEVFSWTEEMASGTIGSFVSPYY